MFSSSNGGISHFSQVSPYLNWSPSASSSFCLNENQALLYHQEDLLSYCLTVAPIIETANKLTTVSTKKTTESTANTNAQIFSSDGDQCCLPILHTQCWPRKQTRKRDRHSKIFTAQGPRDRRVRLSIDISRKFFGLQDLLGFDKASLTLDWLLTKSKTAIKELLQTKQVDDAKAMCLCSLSEDENVMTGTTEEADNGGSKKTADLISFNPNNQSRWTWNQIGTSKSSDSNRQSTMSALNENSQLEGFFFVNPRTGDVNTEEMFQESLRIKRKTKPSSNFGFQRNLCASKEANSDFNNWPSVTNVML